MRRRLPVNAFLWGALVLSACATDSCGCDGFEQRPFPSNSIDQTIPSVGQARVTASGLQYVESQVPYLLQQALPDGLNFCIPRDTSANPALCVESTCPGGAPGCPVDLVLADQDISTEPPDTLALDIVIGDVDERLNFDYDTFIGTVNCYVQVFKNGASESTPATVMGQADVRLFVDQASDFDEVSVDIGEVTVDLSDVDFKIHGRGNVGDTIACEGASLVRGLFRGMIEDQIRGALSDAIEGVRRTQLCRACDAGTCPTGSTCAADGICDYSSGSCVPRTLGMEGRLDVAAAVGDFLRDDAVRIDVVAKAADIARVDSGINVGLRAGFDPTSLSECVPADESSRPPVPNLQLSPSLSSDTKPGGAGFHFGVGLHKSALEHALWSVWSSGGSCLEVSDREVMVLNTTAFSVVAPSMRDFVAGGRAAVLSVVANQAPRVELGGNRVVPSGDTYTIEEPLLRLLWDDVDFHVFAYAQDAMIRLLTLRLDLDIPVAVVPDGAGSLIPIVPDLEDAIANIEPRRLELLSESEEKIRDVVPVLLGVAAPQLARAIPDAIELPGFLGFELQLEQGDITAVDDGQFLAIFASLARAGSNAQIAADTAIVRHEVDYGQVLESGLVRPVVRVDVASWSAGSLNGEQREVEFSWRVDGGFWSMFERASSLTIDDPVLALQGRHEIEIRARVVGEPATIDPSPARVEVLIDWEDPELSVRRDGEWVRFDGFDLADDQLEYRLVDGSRAATDWSSEAAIPHARLGDGEEIVAEARDDSGRITREPVRLSPRTSSAAGCSTTSAAASPTVALFALVFLALRRRTRRRRRRALSALVAASAVFLTACGGCKGELRTNAGQRCLGADCIVDQDCTVDSDCSGICPEGNGGICDENRCMCVRACDPGCEEDAFCCLSTQECVDYGDPCGGELDCDAGYEPGVQMATPNRETCEIEDVTCECVPLPPIDIGWHGSYAAIDSADGLTVVTTYNQTYGDLMIGVVDAGGEVAWHFVDGLPDGGTPEGDPGSFRGGLTDKAGDVGTHTAVVIDDAGRIHAFYRDEDAEALKWGVATIDGDDVKFESVVIDADGEPGKWTAAAIAGDAIHVLYGAPEAAAGSELRHVVVAPSASPSSDVTPQVVLSAASVDQGSAYPSVVASFIDLVVTGDAPFAVFYNGVDDRVGRMQFVDGAWAEPTYVAGGTGPHASGALDADGLEHVAFMLASGLRYSRFGDTLTSLVDDGKREFLDEYWNGGTGEGVALRLDGGSLKIAYQDAFDRALITASSIDGSEWTATRHALEGTGSGFWIAMTRRGEPFVADMVIDRRRESPGYLRVTAID